jgi:hypothetical protein
MDEMALDEAIIEADATIPACTLCQSQPRKGSEVGCYVPSDAMLDGFRPTGWPPDEPFTWWYRLCRRCLKKGRRHAAARIEAKILGILQAERN